MPPPSAPTGPPPRDAGRSSAPRGCATRRRATPVARGMGGDLAAERTAGVGAVFTLALPAAPR